MKKDMRPKWFEEAMMDGASAMNADDIMGMEEDFLDDDGEMPMGQMPMGQMPMGQMPMGQMPMGEMPMGHSHGMHHHGHKMHMHMMLAHAYVPWQCYEEAFCPREALMKGTLFPELFGVYPIPE